MNNLNQSQKAKLGNFTTQWLKRLLIEEYNTVNLTPLKS